MLVGRAKRIFGDGSSAKGVLRQRRPKDGVHLHAIAHCTTADIELPLRARDRVVGGAGPLQGDLPIRGEFLNNYKVGGCTIFCAAIVDLCCIDVTCAVPLKTVDTLFQLLDLGSRDAAAKCWVRPG